MASTYLLSILIIVANKNRWVAANLQQFKYALNKLKKMQPRHLFIQTKQGRTEKSIFQDAKPVSTFPPKLLKISLRGLEQGWISSQLARLGSTRGGREADHSQRSGGRLDEDEPVQMLNCNIRLLLAREPALMNGKIFLTTPTESIMSVPCRAS